MQSLHLAARVTRAPGRAAFSTANSTAIPTLAPLDRGEEAAVRDAAAPNRNWKDIMTHDLKNLAHKLGMLSAAIVASLLIVTASLTDVALA